MKYALSFLFLALLLACNTTDIGVSVVHTTYTKTITSIRAGEYKYWYMYEGERYTAYLDEECGETAIIIIPENLHAKTAQFKKIELTVYDYYNMDRNDPAPFWCRVVDDQGNLYRYRAFGTPIIGTRFTAWIPK